MVKNKGSATKSITEMLTPGLFGSQSSGIVPKDDEQTILRLHLDQIEYSLLNPRTSENPLYEDIKDSIRATRKLITTLIVTKHPGEAIYRLKAGGNTRLQCLKAVYAETGDESMAYQYVIHKPYGSDNDDNKVNAEILIDHLIENVLHSDNTFFEKARGVQQAMALLQDAKDIDTNAMSDRKWITLIKEEYGLPISREAFRFYKYALQSLAETLPIALSSGLGRTTISQIYRLENRYKELIQRLDIDSGQFNLLFASTLSKCDGETVDIATLENTLLDEINQFTDSTQSIEELAQQAKQEDDQPTPSNDDEAIVPPGEKTTPFISESEDSTEMDADDTQPEPSLFVDPDSLKPDHHVNLTILRQEAYQSATQVAKAFHLDSLVISTQQTGIENPLYGFYIEYPPKRLVGEFQSPCWWFLFHVSELLLSDRSYDALVNGSLLGTLMQQYEDKDQAFLFEKFGFVVGNTEGIESWIASMLTTENCPVSSVSKLLTSIQKIKTIQAKG